MDLYTRRFIVASLIYLALGGVLGFFMFLYPGSFVYLQFTHVHVLLAGFMAMMVFGVGYFILPRFAARELKWPWMVGLHFWVANFSLIAMVLGSALEGFVPAVVSNGLGHGGAFVQALSFILFSANLGMTLTSAGKESEASEPATETPPAPDTGMRKLPMVGPDTVALGPDSPVAAFVDRKEGARELLLEAGLRPLADPAHLEMVRARGVTLSHACQRHGIALEETVARLLALPDRTSTAPAAVGPDHIIGELVKRHPVAQEVLRQRFGAGCFTCPGFETETLAQGAMMHGVKVEDLLAELNRAISSER